MEDFVWWQKWLRLLYLVSFISWLNMTSLSLILRLFFLWTFSVKGFRMVQDGKVNVFLRIVLVTTPACSKSDISKEI